MPSGFSATSRAAPSAATVTDADVKPFLALVKAKLDGEALVRAGGSRRPQGGAGLAGLPVPPREARQARRLRARQSRLSYFLWSTMPDDELLALAEKGKLHAAGHAPRAGRADAEGPEGGGVHRELRRPVARPARHRRHRARATCLYPEFDDMLKVSMVRETELFFDEVLKDDLSLTNFVASDFTMLNGRLAKHYGIPGVDGLGVPQGDAAAGQPPRRRADDGQRAEGDGQRHDDLAGHARRVGARPHPRHAAAQAARRTSRPSSRTFAARRRSASNSPSTGSVAACASCHAKIDPPGFALESFDVIGGWRDNYRSAGNGETGDRGRPARCRTTKGPKVDPADVLPDGREVREHRRVQATAAEGQGPTRPRPGREAADLRHRRRARDGRPGRDRGDRRPRFATKNYGFRTLVHEIVQSKLFQTSRQAAACAMTQVPVLRQGFR